MSDEKDIRKSPCTINETEESRSAPKTVGNLRDAGPLVEQWLSLALVETTVVRSICSLLKRLKPKAEKAFYENPTANHPYRDWLVLDAWIRRLRHSGDRAPYGDYFGGCPFCLRYDVNLNIRERHWHVCHLHRVRWCVGDNLFSGWKHLEDETVWKANAVLIADYLEVDLATATQVIQDLQEEGLYRPVNVFEQEEALEDESRATRSPSEGLADTTTEDE